MSNINLSGFDESFDPNEQEEPSVVNLDKPTVEHWQRAFALGMIEVREPRDPEKQNATPSSGASYCPRMCYAKQNAVSETKLGLHHIFRQGNMYEKIEIDGLKGMNVLVSGDVWLPWIDNVRLRGKIDGVVSWHKSDGQRDNIRILEVKTISDAPEKPVPYQVAQLYAYMGTLQMDGEMCYIPRSAPLVGTYGNMLPNFTRFVIRYKDHAEAIKEGMRWIWISSKALESRVEPERFEPRYVKDCPDYCPLKAGTNGCWQKVAGKRNRQLVPQNLTEEQLGLREGFEEWWEKEVIAPNKVTARRKAFIKNIRDPKTFNTPPHVRRSLHTDDGFKRLLASLAPKS